MPSSLPLNPNIQDGETSVNIYGYTPWLSLSVFSCVLFGIALIAHVLFAIFAGTKQKRSNPTSNLEKEPLDQPYHNLSPTLRSKQIVTFETLFSFGCALEVAGYANRAVNGENPFILINFILNYFMIVVAPVFFSAAQYLCLSILLQNHNDWKSLLPLQGKTIVTIFVTADVFTIIMQIVGAALIGVSESNLNQNKPSPITPDQANDILRAGLAIQVVSITIFTSLLGLLLFRLDKKQIQNWKDRSILSILSISTLFIYIRTVYRLVEAAAGVGSGPALNQPLFAALETVPVFIAVIVWTVVPLHVLL